MLSRILPAVTDAALQDAVACTDIPDTYKTLGEQRLVLAQGCTKTLRGFWNGHTMFRTLVRLGLVTDTKDAEVTGKGKRFIADTFLMLSPQEDGRAGDILEKRTGSQRFAPALTLYVSPDSTTHPRIIDALSACGYPPVVENSPSAIQHEMMGKEKQTDLMHTEAIGSYYLLVNGEYIHDLDASIAELASALDVALDDTAHAVAQ